MKKITRRNFMKVTMTTAAVGALNACGASSSTSESISGAVSSAATQDGGAEDLSQQKPYTVQITCFGDASSELEEEISARATEIALAKFNTTIQLTRIDWGSWAQQVNLSLTSGEKMDLFPVFALNSNLSSLVNTGYVYPLTDMLVDGSGKEIYDIVPNEDWVVTTFADDIYGVPFNKGKMTVYGAICDEELAIEAGVDLASIKNLDDFEDALAKVKAIRPEMYPMATTNQAMRVMIPSDTLGDAKEIVLGAITDVREGVTTVENLYGTDDYKEFVNRMYSWTQKGYIQPDAVSSTDAGIDLIRANQAFADFYTGPSPTTEARFTSEASRPMKDVEFFERFKMTAEVAPCWSIAAQSEDPERAMQILNEMWTNQEFANLFIYGIEGKTYDFIDDERIFINYPEGVDAANCGYSFEHWGWPNMQMAYIFEGFQADVYETFAEFNASGIVSPAFGFTFDNTNVVNEYAACTNVVQKYAEALNCGSMNPEGNLDKFVAELEANGIQTIVAEKQAQLDAWLATQA